MSWIPTEVAILGTPHIALPRVVEAYFAFAELAASGRGRHFTITFTYMESGRLDRLQWWWQLSAAQDRGGETVLKAQRQEAIDRFRQHIERWLINSQRRLSGGDPFPQLERLAVAPRLAEHPHVETSRERARMTMGA